jgi:tetratricopeptide (TPR) repeat protein
MEPEKLQKGMQQVALMMQLGSNEVKTLFNKILELSEVLQQNPELFTSILQAEGLLFEALTYERNQQFDKALSTINRAIEFNPKSDLAFARRGEIYRLMERYDKALQDFNQAIELNTKYAWAIRKRGQIFLLIRNYQRALVDLNLAVELDSENDWNLYVRALIHRVLEQDEPAKTDVAQAICMAQADYEKSPDNHRNIFNLALYCLAARKDESAKHFYRDALHRNAPAARIQEAMKDLEDFLTIFPYHSLARKAHQVLQKALQKD